MNGITRKTNLTEVALTLSLLLVTIFVMTGPLFLLFYSPNSLLSGERLEGDISITPDLMAVYLLIVVMTGRLRRYIFKEKGAFTILLLLWLLLLVSSFLYPISTLGISFSWNFLGAIFFYVSASGVLREFPNSIHKVLLTYIIASGVTSIIYLALIGTPFAPVSAGRYFFLGENPNSYSTRMVISVILTLFLAPVSKRKFQLITLFLLPTQLVIIYLSGSRGSLLMLAISFVVFLLSSKLSTLKKVLYSALILLGLFVFIQLYGDSNLTEASGLERILALFESGDSGREQLWEQTYSIFLDHPIIGVGQRGFTHEMMSRYGESRDAHNLFLFLTASGGLVGLSLFLAFYLSLFSSVIKARTKSPLSIALFLAMLLFILKSGGILGYSLLWFVFAIIRVLCKSNSPYEAINTR